MAARVLSSVAGAQRILVTPSSFSKSSIVSASRRGSSKPRLSWRRNERTRACWSASRPFSGRSRGTSTRPSPIRSSRARRAGPKSGGPSRPGAGVTSAYPARVANADSSSNGSSPASSRPRRAASFSSRARPRYSSQEDSRRTRSSCSSSSRKSGSMPASIGRSRRSRAQKELIVPMKTRSRPVRAASSRSRTAPSFAASRARSSSTWNRPRSWAAALRVKVTAASVPISVRPVASRAIMRSTRLFVLPEPAPASTRNVVSRSRTILSRAGWSGGRLFFALITCTRRACRRPRGSRGSPPFSGRTTRARRRRRPAGNRSTCTWLPARR